jgi:CheY-like chemotaxis protein
MSKKRILIVDDEVNLTRMVRLNLEKRGPYEVREENHGRKAIEVAREYKPDLIILDVVMPDMDGGEIAAKMRNDPVLGSIPVIFLTAIVPKREAGDQGLTSGGYLFIPKPVSLETLVRHIEEKLGS